MRPFLQAICIFLFPLLLGASPCADILSKQGKSGQGAHGTNKETPTDEFVAYLSELVERQLIGDIELSRLILGIERGELVNPISKEQADSSLALLIHYQGLMALIESGLIDSVKVLNWAGAQLQDQALIGQKRTKIKNETEDFREKMRFVRVPPGRFKMGDGVDKHGLPAHEVETELKHPFEITSTLITQKQWVEVMGYNPSHFKEGDEATTMNVNGKTIRLKPDHPVENITWWSAIEFTNRLSLKAGLRPVYNLSKVFWEGYASQGNMTVTEGELSIDAPGGDIYLAEGYRLATEAEWAYLGHNLGRSRGRYYFGDDDAQLSKHAWTRERAGNTTQAVAELAPLQLDSGEIFDLYGNVWEWVDDKFYFELMGGANPQRAAKLASEPVSIRGGTWMDSKSDGHPMERGFYTPNSRSKHIGLRVVRSLDVSDEREQ